MDNTTTITFRSQSRSVRVKAPASGYRANPEINQKVSVSGGGTIYTTDFGGETQKLQVQLRRLTRTEYAALKEFILTTCRGSAFSFDLTDYQGTHQNLHYISGLEGAELHRGDLFNVTLQLQKSTDQSIRLGQNLITNPNLTLNPDGRTAEGWNLGASPPATTVRNVDISEDFAPSALEIADTDGDGEWFLYAQKFPIVDLRYTLSAWMNRTAGTRGVAFNVEFYDADGTRIATTPQPPATGWSGRGSSFYMGGIHGPGGNNTWKKGSVTFGPGSTTYIPPAAQSFQVGTLIYSQSPRNHPVHDVGPVTYRVTGFSVIVTP